eukprot:TRINITY_DN3969_c1_g1_i2.p3 TRINITY_DN3969_c1_g1~~TRINITY_DN3969_c1_g1_i2.p3  ORF type:complete len:162 (-),score=3.59 TRINITY_DN3969_c1_g1_i2:201-686(-)
MQLLITDNQNERQFKNCKLLYKITVIVLECKNQFRKILSRLFEKGKQIYLKPGILFRKDGTSIVDVDVDNMYIYLKPGILFRKDGTSIVDVDVDNIYICLKPGILFRNDGTSIVDVDVDAQFKDALSCLNQWKYGRWHNSLWIRFQIVLFYCGWLLWILWL